MDTENRIGARYMLGGPRSATTALTAAAVLFAPHLLAQESLETAVAVAAGVDASAPNLDYFMHPVAPVGALNAPALVFPAPAADPSECLFELFDRKNIVFTVGDPLVSDPFSVEFVDLDSDGDQDMVVAEWLGGFVSVQINDGTGFYEETRYAIGGFTWSAVTGDLNGDGAPDIVAPNGPADSLAILFNNGDGTFAPASLVFVGDNPRSPAMGDIDGDGDLDVLVANASDFTIAVLLNDGAGELTLASSFSTGPVPFEIALADFDGDGGLDAAVGTLFETSLFVHFNDGVGGFGPPISLPFGGGSGSFGLSLNDFDNDGDTDIAASVAAGDIALATFFNNGDGSFGPAVRLPSTSSPTRVVSGDIDNDSDIDIVMAEQFASTVALYRNAGDGSFTRSVIDGVGLFPFGIGLGDVDGDNDLDLASGSTSPMAVMTILRNDGAGVFDPGFQVNAAQSRQRALDTGDIDGDGNLDAVVASDANSSFSVLFGDGQGGFGETVYLIPGGNPSDIETADVNNDGSLDVVVSHRLVVSGDDFVTVHINDGAGVFQAPESFSAGFNPFQLTQGDLDNDGDTDIVVSNFSTAELSVLVNDGAGRFPTRISLPMLAGAFPFEADVADIDNDGDQDIVFGSGNTEFLSMFRNNGDLVFTFEVIKEFAGDIGFVVESVIAEDLDGDLNIDLIATLDAEFVAVFMGTGGGAFADPIEYPLIGGMGLRYSRLADIDGDLDPDLVVPASFGAFFAMLNNGDGAFAVPEFMFAASGGGADIVQIGDFDGDNDNDLLFASSTNDYVGFVENNRVNASCPSDVNGDGVVNVRDVADVLAAFGPCDNCCRQDLNGDGAVSAIDLLIVIRSVFRHDCDDASGHSAHGSYGSSFGGMAE